MLLGRLFCGSAKTLPKYNKSTFWTLAGLDGRLQKASKLKGIKNFKASEMGLLPVSADTWEGFAFIHSGKNRSDSNVSNRYMLRSCSLTNQGTERCSSVSNPASSCPCLSDLSVMMQCLEAHPCALHGIPWLNISQVHPPGLSSWGKGSEWRLDIVCFHVWS